MDGSNWTLERARREYPEGAVVRTPDGLGVVRDYALDQVGGMVFVQVQTTGCGDDATKWVAASDLKVRGALRLDSRPRSPNAFARATGKLISYHEERDTVCEYAREQYPPCSIGVGTYAHGRLAGRCLCVAHARWLLDPPQSRPVYTAGLPGWLTYVAGVVIASLLAGGGAALVIRTMDALR